MSRATDPVDPQAGLADPGLGTGMSAAGTGFLASAAMIAGVTVLARVAGFGRYAVFSKTVNAECVGNAYSSANVLPNILFEVVAGGALAGAVIPLLAGALSRQDRREAGAIVSALLGWVLVALIPASILLGALAGPISKVLIGGEQCAGEQALAARMILIFAPQIVLYGVGVVLSGTLQAHRRFFWPAFAPLLSSAVVIVGYVMFARTSDGAQNDPQRLPRIAEAWLVWGTTAAVAAMTLPLLIPLRRTGIRLRPTLTFPPGIARRGRALALAGIGGLLAQQLSVLAGVLLANHQPGNQYPVFTYAQAVYLLPYAVLAVPLATSAFPRLAERAAKQDRDGFAHAASVSTRAVVVAGLLAVALLAGTAPAIGGFFTSLDTGDLADLRPGLVVMAPGVLGFALIAHVGRALYALHRGRAAAVSIASGWLVVIAGSVIAVPLAGPVIGLAAGNTAGMAVASVLLLLSLRRCAGPAALNGMARLLPAGAVATAIGGASGLLVSTLLAGTDGAAALPATITAGVAAALVTALLFAAVLAALDRHDLGLVTAALTGRSGTAA